MQESATTDRTAEPMQTRPIPKPAADASASERRPSRRRRRWLLLVVVVLVGGGLAGFLAFNNDEAPAPAAASVDFRFEEVTVTDLIEEQSYDATLGTTTADPIRTQLSGTITGVLQAGSTPAEGDILFTVDERPVVLLDGEVPAYRDLATPDPPTETGLANRLSGTVTRVVEGATFVQGDILYWVNEQPVVLLYGDLPQYRTINQPPRTDTSGPDVLQLKEALIALGYDPDEEVSLGLTFGGQAEAMVERWQEDIGANVDGSVDLGEVIYASGPVEVTEFLIDVGDSVGPGQDIAEVPDNDEEVEVIAGADVLQLEAALVRLGFDASGDLVVDGVWNLDTEAAVTEWQQSLGVDDDGIVETGDIVFIADSVRVLEALAPIGTAVNPGGAVLSISSADKLVTMNLPAADQGLIAAGDSVTVELPDGSEVQATIVEVASVATVANNSAVFEVTIALDDPSAAQGLDEAPVDVLIVTASARGVLAVPVTSLLALAEGGYAVEVDEGSGQMRRVGVEPGFFADGLVEVTSSELAAGDRVFVP